MFFGAENVFHNTTITGFEESTFDATFVNNVGVTTTEEIVIDVFLTSNLLLQPLKDIKFKWVLYLHYLLYLTPLHKLVLIVLFSL